MLAPFVLPGLQVVPGHPGAGDLATTGDARAEVVPIGHPAEQLGWQWGRKRPCVGPGGPGRRGVSNDGAWKARWHLLESGHLVPEAEGVPLRRCCCAIRLGRAQERLRADAHKGGRRVAAAVQEGVVLGLPAAQPAGARGDTGLSANDKEHGGGVGSPVGHTGTGGQGDLGQLPAAATGGASPRGGHHRASLNPTTALDEK